MAKARALSNMNITCEGLSARARNAALTLLFYQLCLKSETLQGVPVWVQERVRDSIQGLPLHIREIWGYGRRHLMSF